jgi:hypothetical protein
MALETMSFFLILKLTDVKFCITGSCILGMFQGKDIFMFSFGSDRVNTGIPCWVTA